MGIVIGLLAAASSAAAVTRYASPTGGGAACTNIATPCAIDVAVNSAGMNDDVVLLGGVPPAAPFVTSTALYALSGVDIHGNPGARPVIQSSASGDGVTINGASANLADVIVEYTGSAATAVLSNGGTVSRVSAHTTGLGAAACVGNSGAFFTDSICRYDGSTFPAAAFLAGTGTTTSVNLRNVTAISNSTGVASRSTTSSSVNLIAVNTVAKGGINDVYAFRTSTGGSTVGMTFSNFATSGMDTGASATAAGSGSNLTTPPVFVDSANGDFRQLATSTGTIDRGTASVGLGSFDFEGQARTQGAAPDIGADEGAIPIGGPAPPTATSFDLKAALKKCKKIKSKAKRKKCIKRAKARAGA